MTNSRSAKAIECVIPILRVADLAGSLQYYQRVLGFSRDWVYEEDDYSIANVSRDGFSVMLCQRDQGQAGTWLWIGVENVRTLYSEFQGTGATIIMPPTNFPWALEMQIQDPDGHVFRFGSEPE